jgi:hypothetical protein
VFLRLSDWLSKISTGWVALSGVLIFLLFSVLVLPRQSPQTENDLSEVGSPDLSFYYSADDLYRMADAYGETGRTAYIQARFTFDVIWPIVYTLFLSTSISWVYARSIEPESRLQRANLVPVLGMLCDYLENVSTSLVMWRYPAQTPVIDWLAPVFTALKWILISGSFLLLLGGLVVGTVRWFIKRKNHSI